MSYYTLERIKATRRFVQNLKPRKAMCQIQFTVLPDVPVPKFRLFQQVKFKKTTGVIVTMGFNCALDCLIAGGKHGWSYDVSFVIGKTPEQALGAPEHQQFVSEAELLEFNPVEGI